jgi:hypothetical protein
MRGRAKVVRALVAVLLLLLPGCSKQVGLNQESVVLAVGVDPAERGQYRWTLMLPNPTVTASSESAVHGQNEFFTLSATAPTFGEALAQAATLSDRDLFLGLTLVVVLNPRLPPPFAANVLSALIRQGRMSPRAWVTLGLPTAASVLRVSPPQESVPTVYLGSLFACADCHPIRSQVRLWQVWDRLHLPSHTAVLPVAERVGNDIRVDRVAFLTPRRVRILDPLTTEGWAMLANRYGGGSVTLDGPKGTVSVGPIYTRAFVRRQGGRLTARIHAEGEVGQLPPGANLNTADITRLQDEVARALLLRCLRALHEVRRGDTDPFGLATEASWHLGRPDVRIGLAAAEVRVDFHLVGGARIS